MLSKCLMNESNSSKRTLRRCSSDLGTMFTLPIVNKLQLIRCFRIGALTQRTSVLSGFRDN